MENDIQGKSKTQTKKEAEALQKLGEELAKLPRQQLEQMALPDDLRKALIESRSITSNIAGRRHRQFIGTLMRGVDPEPIRQALLQTDGDLPIESEAVKETRMWLESLLTGDSDVMEKFICEFPGIERQRLRQLLRNIKKERAAKKHSKSLNVLTQHIMKGMSDSSQK